jgi:hypothetical protein
VDDRNLPIDGRSGHHPGRRHRQHHHRDRDPG